MAKSIKLNDETYLDTSSIVHEKKQLNEVLKGTVVFESPNGNNGDVPLNQDISSASYIDIVYRGVGDTFQTERAYNPVDKLVTINSTKANATDINVSCKTFLVSANTLTTQNYASYTVNGSITNFSTNTYGYMRIHKVIAYYK